MKQLCLFTILIVLFSSFPYSFFTELNSEKGKMHTELAQLISNTQSPIVKGSIYWEGWARYFHFHSGVSADKPTSFFVNPDYFTQKVPITLRMKKDKFGYIHIPTKFDFYLTLMHDRLLFLSSRDQPITKASDNLKIEFINPVDLNHKLSSSIKDLGKFQEGYCFSLLATVPSKPNIKFTRKDGVSENWVVCVPTQKEKKHLLDSILQMRLLIQNAEEEEKKEKSEVKNAVSLSDALTPKPTELFERQPDSTLKDGYLMLLKDWSQCTLKCGGGWSYQQWMCIPPKKGGKPCKGDLIRRKPCNTKPCPGQKFVPKTSLTNSGIKTVEAVVLKPILKSLPISTRPQQYVQCVIKESDVLLEEYNLESKKMEKIPARLIMNKRSISLFKDDKLNHAEFNFQLDKTEIYPDAKDVCCLKIASDNKQYKICSFGEDCGDESNRKFVQLWERDLKFFRTRCFEELKKEDSKNVIGQGPQHDKANNILGSMNLSVEESTTRQNAIKKKIEQKSEENFASQLGKTQVVAMQAVKKELGIEEMIKREYALKAKKEVEKLLKVMANEKKKQDSLERALAERQSEDAKLLESRQQQIAVKMMEKEVKQEVISKRNNLKQKIMEIKKKNDRRKRVIEQQINIIRGHMARSLMLANKNGNMETCREANGNVEKIKNYCNANMFDDFRKNMECKELQSFCYVCCENEFGNMHITERDDCYNMCDKKVAAQIESGEFVWS